MLSTFWDELEELLVVLKLEVVLVVAVLELDWVLEVDLVLELNFGVATVVGPT